MAKVMHFMVNPSGKPDPFDVFPIEMPLRSFEVFHHCTSRAKNAAPPSTGRGHAKAKMASARVYVTGFSQLFEAILLGYPKVFQRLYLLGYSRG